VAIQIHTLLRNGRKINNVDDGKRIGGVKMLHSLRPDII
jgi:hypothetical protein